MAEDENAVPEGTLDELMDDIEIEDELLQEETVRKKNAKILLISIVGLLAIAGVYFGINYYSSLLDEEQLVDQAELAQTDELVKETQSPPKEDAKKKEEKKAPAPQKEIKKTDEKKNLPTKEDIKKKETASPDKIKKEKIKEAALQKTEAKKIETDEKVKKEIKGKDLKSSQPPKEFKKASVAKEPKPSAPEPKKTPEIAIPKTEKTGDYFIQFGKFVIKGNSDNLIRSLRKKGFSPSHVSEKDMVNMYRVFAGKFSELRDARETKIELRNFGIEATIKTMANDLYTIQAGSFFVKRNADKLDEEITQLGLTSRIVRVPILMDVHKVFIGYFKTKREALLFQQKLVVKGFSQTLVLNS